MNTAKLGWSILVGPLTAIVVFLAFHGITWDGAEMSADFPTDWPPTSPVQERSETLTPTPAAAPPAAQPELAAMSETFRNTTLLIAIRQSGYVCAHMLGAEAGVDDAAAWRVRCIDALAYLVAVDASGDLSVDPIPYAEGFRPFPYAEEGQPNSTRLDQLP